MENNTYIFIDEFATPDLYTEKEGNASHFIYSAILINGTEIDEARKIREEISKKYFQGRDIKANHIGQNTDKRISILKELDNLKYFIWTLVVDKKEIAKDKGGLRFKSIFIKYFQRILISKINNNIKNCFIYFDETGYPEFQKSLYDFINEKVINYDLFDKTEYKIKDDKSEKLLQIADLIVNTCGQIFSDSHKSKDRDKFFDIIKSRIRIDRFPEEYDYMDISDIDNNYQKDLTIINCAINSINEFKKTYISIIESTKNSENLEKNIEIEILNYLYTEFQIDINRVVSTYELKNYINNIHNLNYNDYKIREIIQLLRDNGVLIVSPLKRKGYKIPANESDIIDSFNRTVSNVEPMLRRVNIANDKIATYTGNKINILEKNFTTLNKLVEVSKRIII